MVTSYKDLKRQIADLEMKAAEAKKVESINVINAIKAQIAEYELQPSDLFEGVKTKAKVRVLAPVNPPKYMDPKTGKTWSGRGKPPTWIAGAFKKGNKDDFLIAAVTAVKAEKEKAKTEAKPKTQAKATAAKSAPAKAITKAAKPGKAASATKATTKAKTPAPKQKPAAAKTAPAASATPAGDAAPVSAAPAEQSAS